MVSLQRSLSTVAGVWLGLTLVQACTAIPCPSGQVEHAGKCQRIVQSDAGQDAAAVREGGNGPRDRHEVDSGGAPDAAGSDSARSFDAAANAGPDAAKGVTPVAMRSDAGPEGTGGSTGGMAGATPEHAGHPAAGAAGAPSPDAIDRDLGPCPAVGSAQLITRHDSISLPETGSGPLRLLSTRCTGDPQPAVSMRALFALHNEGAAEAAVHCTLVGDGARDEGKLTLAAQSVGTMTLQLARGSTRAASEPSVTLSCEVTAGARQVRAESIRMLLKIPQSVTEVAAP